MWKRTNIWFHCPACEKKLVVGIEAGGYRADCPECGINIPIPARSTALPAWARKGLIYGGQFAVVAIAVGVSWMFASEPSSGPIEVKQETTAPSTALIAPPAGDAGSAVSSPSEEINRQLLNQNIELESRYNKMLQWMVENYRGRYPLPERLVSKLRIAPLTETGDISPDLVEMLRLTDEEKVLVQDVVQYVRNGLRQVERGRVQVTEQADHRISFAVPTFPEVGAELKEDLFLTLENTLGARRFDRMVDVAGEMMREQLHYYGEASRTLTFEVIFPATEGAHPPYLLIRDGWVIPEGESVRLTKVTETAVTKLPDSYRDYQDWLPEKMSHYTIR